MELFDSNTGKFHQEYIDKVPDLSGMQVETDYGPGTTLAHWDEEKFDMELMTGFMDKSVYVLPVTINVISLLGHVVTEMLHSKRMLVDIIGELKNIHFLKVDEVKNIDRDYFKPSEVWEEIYSNKRFPLKS